MAICKQCGNETRAHCRVCKKSCCSECMTYRLCEECVSQDTFNQGRHMKIISEGIKLKPSNPVDNYHGEKRDDI
jgi:hypothetical protein